MKATGGLVIAFIFLGGLIAACATPSPPRTEPCRPPNSYQQPPAWEEIIKDAQQIKTLAAKIELTSGGLSAAKIHGLITYQAPDLLRLEVLSPWGQPASYVILNNQQIAFFNFGDSRLILGPAKGSLIKEYLGLDLPPAWLFALLNGRGWIASQNNPQFLGMEEINGDKKYNLLYPEEGFRESIRWDKDTGEVGEIIFQSWENKTVVRAQIEDFLCSRGISFPKTIKLDSATNRQAQITFNQIEINIPLEPSVFEIPHPQEGMKIYYVK